jgi:hypothetical protein
MYHAEIFLEQLETSKQINVCNTDCGQFKKKGNKIQRLTMEINKTSEGRNTMFFLSYILMLAINLWPISPRRFLIGIAFIYVFLSKQTLILYPIVLNYRIVFVIDC